MQNWLATNALPLLLLLGSLFGVYTTMHSELAEMEQILSSRAKYIQSYEQTAKLVTKIQAEQEVTRRYWDRFEVVMSKNTEALREVGTAIAVTNQKLITHDKRINKLEDSK